MGKRIRLGSSITLSVLLIGLLTGTVGLGYAYWYAKHTRRTTIGPYFQELARHSADKVGLVLAKEIEWVERLSSFPEVREAVRQGVRLKLDKPALQQWREEQGQYFRSLAIVDRGGKLVGGVTSETTRTHYAQQPWWPIVFGQGRPWAGDLRVDEKGRGYWEVAVPITGDGGAVLGVLKVAIGTQELFASVLRTRIGQTGHIMLLGQEGQVLACPILPPALHTKTDALSGGRARGDRRPLGATWAQVQDDTHGGQGGIVGVSPVVLPPPLAQERVWQILVRQDPQEIYEPALTLMWKLGGFWAGAIGLIAFLGWRLAHRIVRPLEELVERVRLLGEGRPTRRLEPGRQVQVMEIEALTTSFNSLAERLEEASRETQRYVTELEKANRELAKSEEHYRTLWDHAVDSMLIVDAGGIVQVVNRRGEMKLGRPKEEVVGTVVLELFTKPDCSRFHELLAQVLTEGKEVTAGEMHIPTAAGATLTMELDMVPITRSPKGGRHTAVLIQLSDVIEKKRLEQQLLRSERLASLSQFASMFAHDIRRI